MRRRSTLAVLVTVGSGLLVTLLARNGSAEPNGRWLVSTDMRVASTVELDGDAPSERNTHVPYMSLVAGRVAGPIIWYGKLRMGIPAFYGQIGAGVGATLDMAVGERLHDGRPLRTSVFVSLEGGGAVTFFDAPPEIHYSEDAVLYWGPYVRAELGVRVLFDRPRSRGLAFVASFATEYTWAHYSEPDPGTGRRLGVDLGIGGEVRF